MCGEVVYRRRSATGMFGTNVRPTALPAPRSHRIEFSSAGILLRSRGKLLACIFLPPKLNRITPHIPMTSDAQQEYDDTLAAVTATAMSLLARDEAVNKYLPLIDAAALQYRQQQHNEYRCVYDAACIYVLDSLATIVANYAVDVAFHRVPRGTPWASIVPSSPDINIGNVSTHRIEAVLLIMYIRRGRLPASFCRNHYWHTCPANCNIGSVIMSVTRFDNIVGAHIAKLLD